MDIIHPLDPSPPIFGALYEFDRVLAKKQRATILLFRPRDPTSAEHGKEVVVRLLPSEDEATQRELATLRKVEQMRKTLSLETLVQLRGYVLLKEPLPGTGILMERLPFTHEQLDADLVDYEAVVGFLLDLLHTIWLARKHFQFYHGDMHVANIMFRPYDKSREYVMGGHRFFVDGAYGYLPVIIDFEKSVFKREGRERFSDVRHAVGAAWDMLLIYNPGGEEPPEFKALHNYVLDEEFDRNDNRFTPETIERILVEFDLFAPYRKRITGVANPPKRTKECLACGNTFAEWECSVCRTPFCSHDCSKNAWLAKLHCPPQ